VGLVLPHRNVGQIRKAESRATSLSEHQKARDPDGKRTSILS